LGAQDLDGILSDYVPGAFLFTPEGPLRGVDAIKVFFQALLAVFGNLEQTSALSSRSWRATMAILWTAETADNVYELGTDTFVVRDDRIVIQSFAGNITPPAVKTPSRSGAPPHKPMRPIDVFAAHSISPAVAPERRISVAA
jgi:hypothetical protein